MGKCLERRKGQEYNLNVLRRPCTRSGGSPATTRGARMIPRKESGSGKLSCNFGVGAGDGFAEQAAFLRGRGASAHLDEILSNSFADIRGPVNLLVRSMRDEVDCTTFVALLPAQHLNLRAVPPSATGISCQQQLTFNR